MKFGDILKQAQALQSKMGEMQERIEAIEVEGSSGGGLVRVTLGGKSALKRVAIDPSLLKPEEQGILEDLIIAAHNDAKTKLEQQMQDEMGKLTGGMGLPGGFKLPF
ncbi:MAG: YbaB/EbfC family nucleoid-associated protein [Alphaproteobacteria bacterium]|nr:YbaB/EbfC family nucleoid-associated protein [Alphaproteobacteria bacterium]